MTLRPLSPSRKSDFIDFMLQCNVLRFGDFTGKSGRQMPYFINTGLYKTGAHLSQLGDFYAETLLLGLPDFDLLFGPAYKGIPLVVATAMSLSRRGRDVGFCFNRKEAKDHGEGGILVGQPPQPGARVVIVEDVTTAGTSIRETLPLLHQEPGVEVVGLVVSVDRQERGRGERSALAELESELALKTLSLVNIDEVLQHVSGLPGSPLQDPTLRERVETYRLRYAGK